MLGCAPFDERHNSANIAEWMTRELDNWQLSTVTEMIISDTAANQLGIFNPELVPDLPRHFKPSKLDQILFLRENALMANFDLGWN